VPQTTDSRGADRPRLLSLIGPGNIGFAVFSLATLVLFLFLAWQVGDQQQRYASMAIILTANFLGVPVGFLLTPKNPEEKSAFSSLGKAMAAFGSGWLLSKIDGLTASILSYGALTPLAELRLAGSISCLVLASSAVYVMRSYADWIGINKYLGGPTD
jgi:hypothetical protein